MHVFVRHPPLPAMQGICYGRLDAVPGDDAFAEAARQLACRLPDLPIASSPSTRCLRLAMQLRAQRVDGGGAIAPVHVDPRLRELDFGDWEGHRWDALPREALDAWSADVAGFAPPGGESFDGLIARVQAALADLATPHIVVTHAGVIRAAHRIAGLPHAQAAAIEVPYLQPLTIDAR